MKKKKIIKKNQDAEEALDAIIIKDSSLINYCIDSLTTYDLNYIRRICQKCNTKPSVFLEACIDIALNIDNQGSLSEEQKNVMQAYAKKYPNGLEEAFNLSRPVKETDNYIEYSGGICIYKIKEKPKKKPKTPEQEIKKMKEQIKMLNNLITDYEADLFHALDKIEKLKEEIESYKNKPQIPKIPLNENHYPITTGEIQCTQVYEIPKPPNLGELVQKVTKNGKKTR